MPNQEASDDSGSEQGPSFPSNPQFELQVQKAIAQLKGTVFPKLNWSAPQDATWSVQLLKCTSYSEIFLALQCSSLLHYDLEMFKKHPQIEPHLVLKEWREPPQGSQYRCFVRDKQLVAISQRDCSLYFPFISKTKTLSRINPFFEQVILDKVPLSKYIVDVSVQAKKIRIIDINPWSPATNTLLFTWKELETISKIQFRIVERESTVKANSFDQFRAPVQFQGPNLGETVPQFLQEMKKSYN